MKYYNIMQCLWIQGFAMPDLQQIFLGNTTVEVVVEIIFRTLVMYIYLLLLLRTLGARGIGQLSPFEFAIIIALGSAVGDAMFYLEIPLIQCLLVVTIVVLIQHAIVWVSNRNAQVEILLEGKPYTLIEDGILNMDNLHKTALSHDELFMEIRLAGVEQLGQVKSAYLEVNGKTSVFLVPAEAVRPGLLIVPPWEISRPPEMNGDQPVPQDGDYACSNCGNTKRFIKGTPPGKCSVCQQEKWMLASVKLTNSYLER
jgi:uncharacterized membrane protein YcaP (DUF421 family)